MDELELLGRSKLSSRAKSAEFSGRGGGCRTGNIGGLIIRMFGSLCDDGLSSGGSGLETSLKLCKFHY